MGNWSKKERGWEKWWDDEVDTPHRPPLPVHWSPSPSPLQVPVVSLLLQRETQNPDRTFHFLLTSSLKRLKSAKLGCCVFFRDVFSETPTKGETWGWGVVGGGGQTKDRHPSDASSVQRSRSAPLGKRGRRAAYL